MAGRTRSAKKAALELLESGIGQKALENDSDDAMSSGEEEELDNLLTGNVCSDAEYESAEEGGCIAGGGDGPSRQTTCNYSDKDIFPQIPQFRPKRPLGPQIGDMVTRLGMKSFTRAIDFFNLFMTQEIVQILCDNTNLYGWLTILSKPSYARPTGEWEEVTPSEMKCFLALIVYMGFQKKADMPRHWCTATLYSWGWACRFMSRTRFKAIGSMLHVSHPSQEDPSDKLTKVRPLLDHIKATCSSLYQPKQKLAVDERMVRSKARSSIKQFMPCKPVRFGFKISCLCDSDNGYTVDFNVYTGRRSTPTKMGLSFDVVADLSKDLFGQGYHLFFDNYFTTIPLIEHLWLNKTPACGTTVTRRRGYPPVLKDKEWAKAAKRGDCRYVRTGQLLCQQWKDNQPVCVITTLHAGHDYVMVKRHQKIKDGSHRAVMVKKPAAIHEYNRFKGGIDLSDQLLETYAILHKSRKWWKTLFYHLVDLAVLNSFLLFREWQLSHPELEELQRSPYYSHLEFREELSRQLACISDAETSPHRTATRQKSYFGFDGVHRPMYSDKRRNCKVCYFLSQKENKTNWTCGEDQCDTHMCLNKERNCFNLWHTDEFQRLYTAAGH